MESADLKELLFTFDGRVNRAKWWGVGFFSWLVMFVGYGIVYLTESKILLAGLFIVYIGAVLANLAVSIKRWHDRGKSGWFYLVVFIPLVGPIWALIELGFLSGDEDANEYGPNPVRGA